MSDSGEALLREIHADPDDDAPRIVYADWLLAYSTDPGDHARADLIHTQCALERAHPSEVPTLQARAREILKKYKRQWVLALTRANIRGNWRFRRGFLDAGTLSANRFVEVAPQLFELAPMLRAMVFPDASNELVALAGSPYLARLDDVDLHELCRCGRCKIELELPVLFGSTHTARIKRLILSACRIDSDNAKRLFESPHLHGVRELDLHDNRIDAGGLMALAARPATFHRLNLAGNPLGDAGARVLAGAKELEVEELDLGDCGIDQAGALALAEAPWADGIVKLDMHGNEIGKGASRAALRERFGNRLAL